MSRSLFGPGTFVLGGGAALMGLFLVIGFLLPGSWEASASATLDQTPDAVLARLDSPEGWSSWTTWPDSTSRSGPERGAGATLAWSSRELGSGSFRISEASPARVVYEVRVEGDGGSALRTSGEILLTAVPEGTRVEWTEEGDLGSNPLMGWWALSMDRAQSAELEKSLERLAEVLRAAR